MDVSDNSGTPKSSILIGVLHYKPSILGYHYFWKHPYIYVYIYILAGTHVSFSLPPKQGLSLFPRQNKGHVMWVPGILIFEYVCICPKNI